MDIIVFFILLILACLWGIDSMCKYLLKAAKKGDPKFITKIPFYSIILFYKWRKEIENAGN